ncbi:MAG TPA: hypothetical protein PK954_18650 [Anaerolineales bacterium]|nr:hypothetical protein [Anaerolineales bacterium]
MGRSETLPTPGSICSATPALIRTYASGTRPCTRGCASGYGKALAWIQIVTRREYEAAEATDPIRVETMVDCPEMFERLGVPFCAMGFPAEFFDAPCANLGGLARLAWSADTFLVTLPSRLNGHTISAVAAFRWGYTEWEREGQLGVSLQPLVGMDGAAWSQHLALLRAGYGQWDYRA